MKKFIHTIAFLILGGWAMANDSLSILLEEKREREEYYNQCTQTRHWAVILTTTNYEGALQYAQKASAKLKFELNLQGYFPTDSTMLSSNDTCGCGMIHDYYPRGRYDDGAWVSIETDGKYYIVVAASGNKDGEDFDPTFADIKEDFPDAYLHPIEIWMCCMH